MNCFLMSWNTEFEHLDGIAQDSQCPRRKRSPKQKINYCLNFLIEYSTCLRSHRGHVTLNKISIHKKGNVYSQNDMEEISVMNYLKKAVKESNLRLFPRQSTEWKMLKLHVYKERTVRDPRDKKIRSLRIGFERRAKRNSYRCRVSC